MESCEFPSATLEVEGQTAICGTVSVPENNDLPDGRRIPLEFAFMAARTQSPAPDPVIYLHGGPGGGTLEVLGPVAERLFANHRRTRHIVTFDQRAAALSSRTVSCYQGMAANIEALVRIEAKKLPASGLADLVAPCVEEIRASDADLSAYNTENNARDVRAVMHALGYPEYNIYGISYGTRLALEVLRTAPEGVRSAVIDGVAPPTVKIYEDLAGPIADALDALVGQCEADDACASAYPDLQSTINSAFERISDTPIPASRGRPEIGIEVMFAVALEARNNWRDLQVITPYLPRIFSELAEGRSDTIDAVMNRTPQDRVATLTAFEGLTEDERVLLQVAVKTADAMADLDQSVLAAIDRLKIDLAADEQATSVAEAFEARTTLAAQSITDRGDIVAMIQDYALLDTGPMEKQPLRDWVDAHFSGADRTDLFALLDAMSDDDVARTFQIAREQVTKYQLVLGAKVNQDIFACQEDVPWNSPEGFEARIPDLAARYPFLAEAVRESVEGFFAQCEAFDQYPRPGLQTPVESDVPVLALNGLLDIQTSWKWGDVAVETLSNSRNLVIPEAGHGTIAYQQCPNDNSVAFLNDPTSELDTSCIESLKPEFLLPDDPLPE